MSAFTDLFAGIAVSDLDASIDWYTRFRPAPRTDGAAARAPAVEAGPDRHTRLSDSRPRAVLAAGS